MNSWVYATGAPYTMIQTDGDREVVVRVIARRRFDSIKRISRHIQEGSCPVRRHRIGDYLRARVRAQKWLQLARFFRMWVKPSIGVFGRQDHWDAIVQGPDRVGRLSGNDRSGLDDFARSFPVLPELGWSSIRRT